MRDPNFLQTLWFLLIAVLWIGYFVLEGFDFGVGMLLRALGRDRTEKRMIIHTIGPVWDGNEVWLITAGGATFAAFPGWYASLFSGFYLALFLILAALIIRGVSFEFWGKEDSPRWRATWEWAAVARQLTGSAAVGCCLGEHRPRRTDERPAQRHRLALGPAAPIRAARRPRHALAVPRPRRDLPGAAHARRDRRRARAAIARERLGRDGRADGGLPALDRPRPGHGRGEALGAAHRRRGGRLRRMPCRRRWLASATAGPSRSARARSRCCSRACSSTCSPTLCPPPPATPMISDAGRRPPPATTPRP